MKKVFSLVLLILLTGCGSGGVMDISKLPVSDETITEVTGTITDNPKRHWFKELLCVLTNRHYVEKFDD